MAQIALELGGNYAPCCYIICKATGEDGNLDWDARGPDTVLVQTDWDYPSVASSFGWPMRALGDEDCDHDGTDGTVECPCGLTATEFISAAAEFLDNIAGSGKTVDDPGYFNERMEYDRRLTERARQ